MISRPSALLLLTLFTVYAQPAPGADTAVRMEEGLVLIQAEQLPLSQILGQLGQAADVSITVAPAVDRPVSLSVRGRPLMQALNQIARQERLNMVLGWHKEDGQEPVLVSVDVLPEGDMDVTALPPTNSNWYRETLREHNKEKARAKHKERKKKQNKKASDQ